MRFLCEWAWEVPVPGKGVAAMINASIDDAGNRQRAGYEPAASESQVPAIDEKPRSVYEVVTRQMLEDLKSDLAEVKGRVNTLLWLVAGAVAAEFVLRLIKWP